MSDNSSNSKIPSNNIDAAIEVLTEYNLKEIKSNIEKSATSHIDFWS